MDIVRLLVTILLAALAYFLIAALGLPTVIGTIAALLILVFGLLESV